MNSYDQRKRRDEEVRPAGANTPSYGETVVSELAWVRFLLWTGLPLLGAGAGALIKPVSGWVASLPWAPVQGPFRLVYWIATSFGEPQATIGALGLGAVAGLALAFVAEQESLTVTVSHDRVTTKRGEYSQKIERAPVRSVFYDGNHLVMLGRDTEELLREPFDLDPDRLRAVFVARGYPWRDGGDPYRDDYRLWVEGTPGLPPAADALLRARARALARDNGYREATLLRTELARLGIVVRDKEKHQYWRCTGGHQSA